ncbi:MAG: hypothetical protein ACJAS9_002584 [Polaribacter sp.]
MLFSQATSAKTYMTQEQFLSEISHYIVKNGNINTSNSEKIIISSKTLWLNKKLQLKITQILDHQYPKLRLRYNTMEKQNNTPELITIWFLEEIGKERQISFAIAIQNKQIKKIQVLEFRESRGWEISIPTFSKQFETVGLNLNGNLDENINGITGATMSVNAMKKVSRLALMLDEHVKKH